MKERVGSWVVQRFAGILLQVQARDTDGAGAAIGELDLDLAFADHRLFELADLVAARQVSIEIVFPVEPAGEIDLRVQAESGAHPPAPRIRD